MNETLKLIENRRSIKGYTDKMPSKADIDLIIKAGLEAASGRNMQTPIIIAITDKKLRDRLSEANRKILGTDTDPFYGAPCVLVVLARAEGRTYLNDGSLTMGNMMLAAHSLGLGSCWVHRAREVFEEPEWKAWLKSIGAEGEYIGIGNLILGYTKGDYPKKRERCENRVFFVGDGNEEK